jgi:tetratricopeptide (TPR) repeat protein
VDPDLALALQRAERWIDRARPEKAVDLLEPLVPSAPDDPDLHQTLGVARALSGDLWGGLSALEEAAALSDDAGYLLPLASLYLEAGLHVHALRTFRAMVDSGVSTPVMKEMRETVTLLEQDLARTAKGLDRPGEQVEQGMLDMEQGHRAAGGGDFDAAVAANRRAIRRLGDWPPPHNNLSQALFYSGQPEEAMREVRWVLSGHPGNLHALANGIRFLAWSGQKGQAGELWARLDNVAPRDADERVKKAEAAAVLAEHESVYETLKPLDEADAAEEITPSLRSRVRFFLAVAEANTGRLRQAVRRLRALKDSVPLAAETLDALNEGRSGTGWTDYFRYFSPMESLPGEQVDALLSLAAQEGDMPPQRFRRRMNRLVERFPQIVLVAEKMIWEEQQPEAGVSMLSTIGTPEAYAAMRRFALSQAGDDQARAEALSALVAAGEIAEGEIVRAWLDGEWREVELSLHEAPDEMVRESNYAPRVIITLNRAMTAQANGDVERAEELFGRVLELDPNVKEAYNNLGAIYARREEHEQAKEMFGKAVEIDPLYLFPRVNLINYLLDEERVGEAEELLKPLSEASGLYPHESALLDFTRARVLVSQAKYNSAKQVLGRALETKPDYEPAQDLLEWIEGMGVWGDLDIGWSEGSWWEEQWERDLAWRERLQGKLSTLEPTLAEALPLYTKDALTETARYVIWVGGWSQLRKAELVDAIIEALTKKDYLPWIVARLSEEEKEALRTVLARGGAMGWEDFDACYGNDLDESRYWQWHPPETVMGRLRLHGFLVEATVGDELYVVVPVDLREDLGRALE